MADAPDRVDFKTTRWPLVRKAANDPSALGELLHLYWPPMYAYVRCLGFSRDDAADIIQDFVLERMVDGTLVQTADDDRGRFRVLIKASLRHFVIDQVRRGASTKRSPRNASLMNLAELDHFEPRTSEDPSMAFDRQWVSTLLEASLSRVRAECERDGLTIHWQAFERSIVLPILGRTSPASLADLAKELGEESVPAVSSKIQTVRRRFKLALRQMIEDTILDPRDAELEAAQLRSLMMF